MGRSLRMATILLVTLPLVGVAVGAKQAQHRVAAVVDSEVGLILGGSVDGRWADAAQVARLLRGGERYGLYTLTKHLGSATGTKPEERDDEWYDEAHVVKLRPAPKEDCIAILGEWDALPRPPKVERTDQRAYQDIVRSALKRKGISSPVVRITQVLRVDLEGDGVDEVLLSAISRPRERLFNRTENGDYSVVLLRKVISGKARTITIDGSYQPTAPPEGQLPSTDIFTIRAVLDANGDGTEEVFVSSEYWEGGGLGVFAVNGPRVKLVFGQGWGV